MNVVSVSAATYAALVVAETIGGSQDADLKHEGGSYRLWLPRVTDADAAEYEVPVSSVDIEVFDGDRWVQGSQRDLPAALAEARNAGLPL